MTVEVISNQAEIYRISKSDYLHFFEDNEKVLNNIKSTDIAQQINLIIKLDILEDLSNKNKLQELKRFEFIESTSIITTIPEIFREGQGITILKDTLNKETPSKLNIDTIKSKLQLNKQNNDTKSEAININQINQNKDLSKNIALGTQRIQPKTINKFGLSETQIQAKNKLDLLSSVKKNLLSQDEISNGFKKINELKQGGEKCMNKLLSGFESSNENISFSSLSDKLHKKEDTQTILNSKREKKDSEVSNKELNHIAIYEKKESKEDLNIISKIDDQQLIKKRESLLKERKSEKNIPFINKINP